MGLRSPCSFWLFEYICCYYRSFMTHSFPRILFCSFLLLLGSHFFSFAQVGGSGEDGLYKQGLQLFEKEQYSSARFRFREAMTQTADVRSLLYGNAQFYEALCALELNHSDAPGLVNAFIADQPSHPGLVQLRLRMGRYYFDKKDYEQVLIWLPQVSVSSVPAGERDRYYFELGYSFFSLNQPDKARTAFYQVDASNEVFGPPALYYYSHILYSEKQYEAALQGFVKLRGNVSYSGLVSTYVAQILYLQEKFREVTEKGPDLLQGAPAEKRPELLRLIGESYFRLDQYREALNYLSGSVDGREPLPEENYRLGFCLYKLDRFEQAVPYFEKAATAGGALAQNASFHLADCYLKLNQKEKAREAFAVSGAANVVGGAGGASSSSGASAQAEEALFNEAVLTYELKDKPVNDIIGRFTAFIDKFPYSARVEEAYSYLALLYNETRNYRLALEALQRTPVNSDKLRSAYQRVAYFRALELFEEKRYGDALNLLDKSLEFASMDASMALRCYYLKGEAYYGLGQSTQAIAMYRQFLTAPGASVLEEYPAGLYGLGYVYFSQKSFVEARSWFSRFISLRKEAREPKVSDALCRMGDSYFMQSQYASAIEWYRKVSAMNLDQAEYALFQTGFALGLLNDYSGKISTLEDLINKYPLSVYADDAWYEIGRSHISLGQKDKAIAAFLKVVDSYPRSDFKGKALQQLGLVYYNMDDLESSLKYYSRVVRDFPGTEDARNALTGIRDIYVDRNTPEAYFDYVASLGSSASLRSGEQDSLTFKVAENLYMQNQCAEASTRLRAYLSRFPSGVFGMKAHFYLADCLSKSEEWEEALSQYADALKVRPSLFREPSLKASAAILFRLKRYAEALDYYGTLVDESVEATDVDAARLGQLRCVFLMGNYAEAVRASAGLPASKVLTPAELTEVKGMLARALYEQENYPEALKGYRELATEVQTAGGAEAMFRVADILFRQGKLDEAQKVVFDFGAKKSPQLYWMAKSYLVLSDIYVARKDSFMARQTLQSLMDNYGVADDGILESAREKLKGI